MRRWPRIAAPHRHWDEAGLRRNIGVYIHIPFCLHRCSYCDFLTYGDKRPAGLTPPAYVDALLAEIAARGEWAHQHYGDHGRHVDTVFFGGGTPTYLEPEVLGKLVRAVKEHFPVLQPVLLAAMPVDLAAEQGEAEAKIRSSTALRSVQGAQARQPAPPNPEITIEANPDTLTRAYLDELAAAGVNRLSIGVQATQTRHLRLMQRTHRWDDIAPRLAWLPGGPIPRYSFDLIYGLPDMTVADVKLSLRRLLEFSPEHISAYELIYEPGTPLHKWARHHFGEPDERARLAQHRAIGLLLAGHGLYRYEISNYARPGAESRHSLRYWRGGDYIGLGIGAASRFGTEVVNNPRKFEAYRALVNGRATVSGRQDGAQGRAPSNLAPPADIFLRMRTRAGMELNGHAPDPAWLARGWVRPWRGRLEVTSRGLSFADLYHRELA